MENSLKFNGEYGYIILSAMKDVVLVDLNWVLYRSFFVFPNDKFIAPNGHPNGHLYGLAKTLQTLDRMGFLVFLCEDGKCDYRKQLNEHYKEGRTSQGFYKDYDLIHQLTNDMKNVYCLSNPLMEADDIIYSASQQVDVNTMCYIHSADNDLYQCLKKPNVRITKSIKYGDLNAFSGVSSEYSDKYPVPPSQLPIFRALKGDSSDNLPAPVPRFPTKLAVRLSEYFSNSALDTSLEAFSIEKESERKWIDALKDNFDKFELNYKMMKLDMIDFNVVPKTKQGNSAKIAQDYGLFQFANYLGYKPDNVELL